MNPNLTETDGNLVANFHSLNDRKDLAKLLEVDYKTLVYILYRNHLNNYKKFLIPKKDGSQREIAAPNASLKIIQQKLNYILTLIYEPSVPAFGYVKDRNIVKNAAKHLKNKLVLNIDLQDFFPSIHLGRIRGMFMARPYKFPHEVATTLAQICCLDGKLPQGSPTSPIISNMLCAKLDAQLLQLAAEFQCTYTRYADDITFSTSLRHFPQEMVKVHEIEKQKFFIVGDLLKNIIEKNSFLINVKKLKVSAHDERQIVTGIKVNEKLNVSRQFIHSVRAMLHAWKVYGYTNASKTYFAKHYKNFNRKVFNFDNVLKGKIEFIKNVKSDNDFVFRNLANKYARIRYGITFDKYLMHGFESLQSSLWIIKCGNGKQGTGFVLKDIGLVTCRHVVEEFIRDRTEIRAYKFDNPSFPYHGSIVAEDKNADMAVLTLDQGGLDNVTDFQKSSKPANHGDLLTVCGFPDFDNYHSARIQTSEFVQTSNINGIDRILVRDMQFGGMSGGPVLNSDKKVVGIIVTGIRDGQDISKTIEFGITPISALGRLNI